MDANLRFTEIGDICRDISNGIAFIHAQRETHRDLKPHNGNNRFFCMLNYIQSCTLPRIKYGKLRILDLRQERLQNRYTLQCFREAHRDTAHKSSYVNMLLTIMKSICVPRVVYCSNLSPSNKRFQMMLRRTLTSVRKDSSRKLHLREGKILVGGNVRQSVTHDLLGVDVSKHSTAETLCGILNQVFKPSLVKSKAPQGSANLSHSKGT